MNLYLDSHLNKKTPLNLMFSLDLRAKKEIAAVFVRQVPHQIGQFIFLLTQ
jgi:hypothetical protein